MQPSSDREVLGPGGLGASAWAGAFHRTWPWGPLAELELRPLSGAMVVAGKYAARDGDRFVRGDFSVLSSPGGLPVLDLSGLGLFAVAHVDATRDGKVRELHLQRWSPGRGAHGAKARLVGR